jgi:ABC-type bacteriocin/lantibiotic exporter with double-glycine peptidase domain
MCGPSSLFFIARHYGLNVTYANILKLEPQRDNETSFADLKTMADKLHLCSYGIQTTLAEIKLSKPIGILHVDNNHFVALIGYSIDGVIVDDINSKTNSVENIWSFSTLSHRWDGRLLIIKLAPKSL